MKRILTPEQRTKHWELFKVGSLMSQYISRKSPILEEATQKMCCNCQTLLGIATQDLKYGSRIAEKWDKLGKELLPIYNKL